MYTSYGSSDWLLIVKKIETLLELPQLNLHRLTSKRTFISVLIIALENAFAQPTYYNDRKNGFVIHVRNPK